MGLREELLSKLAAAPKPTARNARWQGGPGKPGQTTHGVGRHRLAAGGVLLDEYVTEGKVEREGEDEGSELEPEDYFHAQRVRELVESVTLADRCLIDGVPAEHKMFEDADTAHAIVMEQIRHYGKRSESAFREELVRAMVERGVANPRWVNALAHEVSDRYTWDHGSDE